MATNNDLLMDELNVNYFAPKLWLYGYLELLITRVILLSPLKFEVLRVDCTSILSALIYTGCVQG